MSEESLSLPPGTITAGQELAHRPSRPELKGLPQALQIYLDDNLFETVTKVATRLAKAEGFAPRHLIGKPDVCFFVVEAALSWRLSVRAVAAACYQTPGGQIGFYGSLVNAIIEQSGRLEPRTGGVRFEHFGDWGKIEGRFEIRESRKDNEKKYAAATWTHDDAVKSGAGVVIRARMRGEAKDREFKFYLSQAFPLNSTLWATDPRTQIVYLATRRFANLCLPGVLMGFADPVNDSEPETVEREVDAERVHEEREPIGMPQPSKSEAAPVIEDPVQPSRAQAPEPKSSADDRVPAPQSTLTKGQIAILQAKMKQYNVGPEEVEKIFGARLEVLPFDMFSEVQRFITGEQK